MKRQHPTVRAPKANQQERAQRQTAIDTLLQRALRGVLTIPEAAVLADYVRAERQLADKTRHRLGDTTRALQNHREAADAEVQRLEARVAELQAALDSVHAYSDQLATFAALTVSPSDRSLYESIAHDIRRRTNPSQEAA